ncbi:mannosyltransferase family protein [Curtobacterium ammoniigenes]|uniref:mannosyltransferase family protein n=1 Tax=Curtobacterium ammoniigenes TaxID=395387 RepID=UPI000835AF36|nr:mannosyltransferase family protein [Curtobacterium ammoniigenes]
MTDTNGIRTRPDRGVAADLGTLAGLGRTLGIRRLAELVQSMPGWAAVLSIWGAGRAVSTLWLAAVWPLIGRDQPAGAIRGNDHGFLSFLTSWDGQYYEQISVHGYPTVLPIDGAGHVLPNAWAFLPAFPFVVRMLTASTGLPFQFGAPLVATVAGLLAAALLYLVVRERGGRSAALWATLFFCIGPISFLLEVGYAESMFLALVFGSLLAIQRRQYGVLAILGIVAAFTRPGGLAIPLTLAVVTLVRLRDARRLRASGGRVLALIPPREWVAIVTSGAAMTLAGFSWPLIAARVTGVSSAYLQTEMSWWVGFVGRVPFIPMAPWFYNAGRWLGIGGILLVLMLIAAYVVWLSRRSTRELGVVPVTFSAAYALYIFAVSLPMASTPRLLMPLAPLFGSRELVSRPWARWTMVIGALVGQPVCIAVLWLLGPP